MCGLKLTKSLIPFVLAFVAGVLAVSFFVAKRSISSVTVETIQPVRETGSGYCSGASPDEVTHIQRAEKSDDSTNQSLQITSQPKPFYTETARANQTQGAVRLRVEFLENGKIGQVTPVSSLPDGLTEQAILAAKQIKFNPAMKDGKAVTTTRVVEFRFTIY